MSQVVHLAARSFALSFNHQLIQTIIMYGGYHIWGMHLLWWVVWAVLLFWIFAMPYNIPGQRQPKNTPHDILLRRLASGQITTEQYNEQKQILDTDSGSPG